MPTVFIIDTSFASGFSSFRLALLRFLFSAIGEVFRHVHPPRKVVIAISLLLHIISTSWLNTMLLRGFQTTHAVGLHGDADAAKYLWLLEYDRLAALRHLRLPSSVVILRRAPLRAEVGMSRKIRLLPFARWYLPASSRYRREVWDTRRAGAFSWCFCPAPFQLTFRPFCPRHRHHSAHADARYFVYRRLRR